MHFTVKQMTLCALCAALISVLSPLAIPLTGQVPISLATLAVMVAASLEGTFLSAVSVIIYIFLGIIGIVFSACSVVWSLVKFGGFLTALFTSISSGSLGIFEEYFQGLGESLRGGMISAFHFLFH